MDLNLHIIASDIRDLCTQTHILTSYEERTLRYPSFYQEDKPLDPTVLYIIPSGQEISPPPSGQGLSFIFIGEALKRTADTCDHLVVRPDVTAVDLLDRLHEIYSRYQQWENSLQLAVIRCTSLKKIGYISLDIFDNAIQFYNQKTLNCVFAVADPTRHPLPEALPSADQNGYMDEELLLHLKIEHLLTTVALKPMFVERNALELPALMQDIVINDSHVGRIIILQVHKPLDQRDAALLMVLTEHIRLMLLHNPSLYDVHSQYMDSTLSKLIRREPVDDAAVYSVLQLMDWMPEHAFFCMAARLSDRDHNTNSLHMLAALISNATKNNCFLIHDNTLIFVFDLTVSDLTRDAYFKKLLPLLRDNLLKAGISTSFHDFRKLYLYYRQAVIALDTGIRSDPSLWYFRFEDHALEYLASRIYEEEDPLMLCPEPLIRLIRYEQKKDHQYLKILKTYLACNSNISETAKQLYMHRNTLLYRLDRIREILGDTLDRYDTRLLLMLALYIIEPHE